MSFFTQHFYYWPKILSRQLHKPIFEELKFSFTLSGSWKVKSFSTFELLFYFFNGQGLITFGMCVNEALTTTITISFFLFFFLIMIFYLFEKTHFITKDNIFTHKGTNKIKMYLSKWEVLHFILIGMQCQCRKLFFDKNYKWVFKLGLNFANVLYPCNLTLILKRYPLLTDSPNEWVSLN